MIARYGIRWYLAGSTCARTGDEMSGPALLLLGIAVTGSTAAASLIYAGLTIAGGIGGPVFGAVLDRSGHPGRVLAVALVTYAAGLGTVAVLLGRAPVAVAAGVVVVAGLLAPALAGGWTAQLASLVPPGRLARGHTLDAATYNVASLAGPAFAAGIAGSLGAPWAIAGAVTMLVAAAPLAWRLPAREKPPGPGRRRLPGDLRTDLRAGFHAIARIPGLRAITTASCVAYLGFGMFVVACPRLGQADFGSPARGALLLSLVAATALLANAALARWPPAWRPESTFLAATTLAAAGLLLAAFAANPVVLVTGAAVLGVADGPQLAAIFALRQRDAPARLRGQVFTTAASLKLTAGAVGAMAGGALIGNSAGQDLVVAATMQVGAVIAFTWMTRRNPGRPGQRPLPPGTPGAEARGTQPSAEENPDEHHRGHRDDARAAGHPDEPMGLLGHRRRAARHRCHPGHRSDYGPDRRAEASGRGRARPDQPV
ncbi:MAG: MFS transporter [Streptosporangiaceae bacterium]